MRQASNAKAIIFRRRFVMAGSIARKIRRRR